MAERKKWDKQQEFQMPLPATTANGSGATDEVDPVLKKQRQYIKILEERNRLKKRLASKQQKGKEALLQEREEAFVTTFNVPKPASISSGSTASANAATVRKNKSASALLPTKMNPQSTASTNSSATMRSTDEMRQIHCKSAPTTKLNVARSSSIGVDAKEQKEETSKRIVNNNEQRGGQRAKWSRPQGPMNFVVETRNGKARFCFISDTNTAADEEKEEEGDDDEELKNDDRENYGEESYLEESFEDFDDEEENSAKSPKRADAKEIMIEEQIVEEIDHHDAKLNASSRHDSSVHRGRRPSSPSMLSGTTYELFGMIKHLSRSKQKALIEVLHKFEASEQQENDVKELRSSIGDPKVWKQLTSALFPLNEDIATSKTLEHHTQSDDRASQQTKPPAAAAIETTPLTHVLEEQRRWEEQYAREVKEKLLKEREEKEKALRQAEARRAAMMKQLEDEEKELEMLMEIKRKERLAKLKALEQELDQEETGLTTSTTIPVKSNEEAKLKQNAQSGARIESQISTSINSLARSIERQQEKHHAEPEFSSAKAVITSEPPSKTKKKHAEKKSEHNDDLHAAAKTVDWRTPQNSSHTENLTAEEKNDESKPVPLVPRLNLSSSLLSSPLANSLSISSDSSNAEIRIKLLSTWSHTRAVGLTQICVYDMNGVEIDIDPVTLKLYEQADGKPLPKSHEMVRGLHRLLNGIAHTNAEHDMWLGRLSDAGTLQVGFDVSSPPSKLCIWNYNSKLCAACVRDVEVLVNGKCVWTGSLPETFGDADENICTWINVLPTAKKTARTARQDDSTSKSTVISTYRASSAASEPANTFDRMDSSRKERESSDMPMWLSSSSTSLTSRAGTSLEAKLDVAMDRSEEKTASGSITARRRQQQKKSDSAYLVDDMRIETAAQSKHTERERSSGYFEDATESKNLRAEERNDREYTSGESAEVKKQPATVPSSYASISSWDSLEHFSKTNRSRLPQPTNETTSSLSGHTAQSANNNSESPALSRSTSFKNSSSLLSELKAMSGTVYNSHSKLPSFVPQEPSACSYAKEAGNISLAQKTKAIPVLPTGRRLKLEILSTWGDPYYVGLNGIELFDEHGRRVQFRNPQMQVTACPASINILDEYHDDPRVATNLVDGVNLTCDDFHMWLAPFTIGDDHSVSLEMDTTVSLSMVRIWNYNKSRAHSFRGVRNSRLVLFDSLSSSSGKVIFEGEICKAPGLVGTEPVDNMCEVILFTREEKILQAIEANDEVVKRLAQEQEEEEMYSIAANVQKSMERQRPRTSDRGHSEKIDQTNQDHQETYAEYVQTRNQGEDGFTVDDTHLGKYGRPLTAAVRPPPFPNVLRKSMDSWMTEEPQQKSPLLTKVSERDDEETSDTDEQDDKDDNLIRGRRITIQLGSTWGDSHYIGLTQLDVLVGKHGASFPLTLANIDAIPRDLASLGYNGDPRTLDKLIDGIGTTCDDTHMWLIPLQSSPKIHIDLKKEQFLYGLRVWNYNKSEDDTYRGVKQIHVCVDDMAISPPTTGFILRKAPGTALFDFNQELRFSTGHSASSNEYLERIRYPFHTRTYKTPLVRQDYEAPLYPQGFILKLVCWTTWGDPYYLGLNGLEIYDFQGKKIHITPQLVTAHPFSVSDLSTGEMDVRVPSNLLNGCNKNTWGASNAWLAPLASSIGNSNGNRVYFVFDSPIVISLLKFWNYSKTPERGVKDLDIYLDDFQIFSGSLRKAPASNNQYMGRKAHVVEEEFSQPILFTSNQAQVDQEKRKVMYCGLEEQDVLCINEGQVMQESKAMYRRPDPGAEGVVVDLGLRPMTAMCKQ